MTETKSRAAELAQFFKFYIAGSEKAYMSICTCDVLYLHETVTVGLHSLRSPAVTRYLIPLPCSNIVLSVLDQSEMAIGMVIFLSIYVNMGNYK